MESATALQVGNKAGNAALLLAHCTARVKAFLMVCRVFGAVFRVFPSLCRTEATVRHLCKALRVLLLESLGCCRVLQLEGKLPRAL